eukprot:PhM_4_TR14805/c0_g1_i1/m.89291/K01876/DARS, aspS; aspartyl-tRNA synthetase
MSAPTETAPAAEAPTNFGMAPAIQSTKFVDPSMYTHVHNLSPELDGKVVTVRARVNTTRAKGKLAFLVLRHNFSTVQVVFSVGDVVTKDMIKFIGKLNLEAIVEVTGKVTVAGKEVAGTTQSKVELQGEAIFIVSDSQPVLPFQLVDASAADTSNVSVNPDTRLDTRWLDNRTPANMSIFKIQSRVCQYWREFLGTELGFTEIHTPKINITATEGAGASVFKLDYFGKPAFLAQSPQLYKQMALQGDMDPGVFEIAPVFRSENANTHRHLTEFVGLDMEMVIYNHYYEVLNVAEALFHRMFERLLSEDAQLVAHVAAQYPSEPLKFRVTEDTIERLGVGIYEENIESKDEYGAFVRNRKTPSLRLGYGQAIALLNKSLPEAERLDAFDDISTTNEKLLGQIVKERYGVEFYIVDKFPSVLRPFYTMPSADDVRVSNSYDIFLRGEEISSGAQRIHNPDMLMEMCKSKGTDTAPIMNYINSFKLGGWPHGGFGVGMERVVMLFLGLKNVRLASLYPRDPRRVTP